ncbi:hypothetical protein [Arhodomonas sp. AD133]|uniref:hypothetical protein n=1 Tax=Arhodomonas sp. AD133 TaxID=3415009 RepID=UPI003EB9C3A1
MASRSEIDSREMRKRLAGATLCAAALITPIMWLTAGGLVGDFLTGVWVGTLAAFIMVAGPLAVPARPALSRAVVSVVVMTVGALTIWLIRDGLASPQSGGPAPLIVFGVGAVVAHASWSAQISRLSRQAAD